MAQLAKIGYQLYSDSEEKSEDDDGNRYTASSQKAYKIIVEKSWFERNG
jgi:hypothetical protein